MPDTEHKTTGSSPEKPGTWALVVLRRRAIELHREIAEKLEEAAAVERQIAEALRNA